MKCIYCGAELTGETICRNCGADVSIQKRIVRFPTFCITEGWKRPLCGIFPEPRRF